MSPAPGTLLRPTGSTIAARLWGCSLMPHGGSMAF
jgi:hypothetical protein